MLREVPEYWTHSVDLEIGSDWNLHFESDSVLEEGIYSDLEI